MQCVVLKFGTSVVSAEDGAVAKERLDRIVEECSDLVKKDTKILIVSSGAIGLGRAVLKLKKTNNLSDKQAAAAVGQSLLMRYYYEQFSKHGLTVAQVLVSAEDFSKKENFENLKRTLTRLLELGVVPILNENDCVSTNEIEATKKSFGDNDALSAIIATKVNANLLVLLSDVEGVYSDNPKKNPKAKKLSRVSSFEELSKIQTQGKSEGGRGGMTSKLQAVKISLMGGVPVVIASGFANKAISNVFSDSLSGTLFRLDHSKNFTQKKTSSKLGWIGMSSGYRGVILVNSGAEMALKKGASLLPVGVVASTGTFLKNEVVSIQNEKKEEIGRGLSYYSSQELKKMFGKKSTELKKTLGPEFAREIIHRNNLVMFI